jgi:hypothetical protein
MFKVASKARAVELTGSEPYWVTPTRKYQLLAVGKAKPQNQVTLLSAG